MKLPGNNDQLVPELIEPTDEELQQMNDEGFYDPTDRIVEGRFIPQQEQNSVGDMLREDLDNFRYALNEEMLLIARGAEDLLKSLPNIDESSPAIDLTRNIAEMLVEQITNLGQLMIQQRFEVMVKTLFEELENQHRIMVERAGNIPG